MFSFFSCICFSTPPWSFRTSLTIFLELVVTILILLKLVLHGKVLFVDDASLLCFDSLMVQVFYYLAMPLPLPKLVAV